MSLSPLRTSTAVLRASRDRTTALLMAGAFALPHAVLLSVVAGIRMFWLRSQNPTTPTMSEGIYLLCATVAGVLLIVPILSMGMASARLGLERRAHVVASLRLLGVGGGSAKLACVWDTVAHALAGVLAGTVLYVLVLPLWPALSFQGRELSRSEMLLPLPYLLVAAVLMLALAALSAWSAMRRVTVSPLGVIRHSRPQHVNPVPAIVALVIFAIWGAVGGQLMALSTSQLMLITLVAGVLSLMLAGLNALGILSIMLLGHLLARLSRSATMLVAARRVIDNPRAVWRSCGALSLTGFVFAVIYPLMHLLATSPTTEMDAASQIVVADINQGLILTLVLSLALSVVATLISQATHLIDQYQQSQALNWMGVQHRQIDSIGRLQIAVPAAVSIALAVAGGLVFGAPLALGSGDPAVLGATVLYCVGAISVVVASSWMVTPLRHALTA